MLVFTRTRSGHPLADHEPGLRFFVIFGGQKPAYSPPESPGIDLDFGDGFAPDSPLQRGVSCEPNFLAFSWRLRPNMIAPSAGRSAKRHRQNDSYQFCAGVVLADAGVPAPQSAASGSARERD